MRSSTTLEERMMIAHLAEQSCSDREIAAQVGWTVPTVRKWRRRAQHGPQALAPPLGRPPAGALGTFPAAVRAQLQAWRTAHPGWGAKTLRAQLEAEPSLVGQPLPSRRSIARFLKATGGTRSYQPHSTLPPVSAPGPSACHEQWQMDARGYSRVEQVGTVALINLNDCYSHVRLLSYPCYLGPQAHRHPTTEDYQLVLRLAFSDWGLPDRLSVDHESVFYDNLDKSPYPTRLHLWLLALGVTLLFSRYGRPTDQGLTERSHQLWDQQVLESQQFAQWSALQQALTRRRDFVNGRLPCATLGERPPLVAHPEALRPRRPYRPEWEAQLLDRQRVADYLARGEWFRLASNIGAVTLGGRRYALGRAWARWQVTIHYDATDDHLVFAAGAEWQQRLPAKGLTVEALMGDLSALTRLPARQLAFPISRDDWRMTQLCGTLAA